MKLLIAGNKEYGLAKSLYKYYPDATFLSRTSGYDLTNGSVVSTIASMSLDYDVFISVSCLYQYKQILLVESIAKQWMKTNHAGYLITVGSSADTPVKGTVWGYPAEKKALRAYTRQLSQIVSSETPPSWKSTYISPGNIHTQDSDTKYPGVLKLDPNYIATVIKWLIDQPQNINISELCLDRIKF